MATIDIGARGRVESSEASGAETDFPGLSACVASAVKEWEFPRSAGSTTLNIPFVFAAR
jgi:hypothetical protein